MTQSCMYVLSSLVRWCLLWHLFQSVSLVSRRQNKKLKRSRVPGVSGGRRRALKKRYEPVLMVLSSLVHLCDFRYSLWPWCQDDPCPWRIGRKTPCPRETPRPSPTCAAWKLPSITRTLVSGRRPSGIVTSANGSLATPLRCPGKG